MFCLVAILIATGAETLISQSSGMSILQTFPTRNSGTSTCGASRVAYPSLRVAVQQIKSKRVRGLPPTGLGPLSIETSHLDINCHLGSPGATETADLPQFAPQFAVGTFQ